MIKKLMAAAIAVTFWATITPAQASPGQITSLSATTLERSGYLEIFGSNFGTDGSVLIDGISAPVADWQSTKIVAYVPEAAQLAAVPVQVINTLGETSNTLNLTVTVRQLDGQVNWRFRQNGPYSKVRPVIGPDGTIYSIDAFSHLYALTPDGGLKWLVRGAGSKGVAVGTDSTVYTASESAVQAFNADGSAKWTYVENPMALFLVGISVGPDGNIYAVATEGVGVFSLTPAGVLRWKQPEPYDAQEPVAVTVGGATVAPGIGGSGSVVGAPIVSADGKRVTVNLTGVTNTQTISVKLAGVSDGMNTNDIAISHPWLALSALAPKQVSAAKTEGPQRTGVAYPGSSVVREIPLVCAEGHFDIRVTEARAEAR